MFYLLKLKIYIHIYIHMYIYIYIYIYVYLIFGVEKRRSDDFTEPISYH